MMTAAQPHVVVWYMEVSGWHAKEDKSTTTSQTAHPDVVCHPPRYAFFCIEWIHKVSAAIIHSIASSWKQQHFRAL